MRTVRVAGGKKTQRMENRERLRAIGTAAMESFDNNNNKDAVRTLRSVRRKQWKWWGLLDTARHPATRSTHRARRFGGGVSLRSPRRHGSREQWHSALCCSGGRVV